MSSVSTELPLTLVSDGQVLAENLKKANKTHTWLNQKLQEHQADLKSTYLLTVDGADHVFFCRKEPV